MDDTMLELSELLVEANRLRESIPELADTDEFSDRTVYYYAQQGLLPRSSRRRGPGTRYPADFVDRLLFIRRLQKEQSLTLANIREVMGRVSRQTLHDVGRGVEPLEIRVTTGFEPESVGVHREVIPLQASSRALTLRDTGAPSLTRRDNGRSAMLTRRAKVAEMQRSINDSASAKHYSIGANADLEIRRSLSPLQEKRVDQVVDLLRSILEEDE